jgi:hypothetical protein
VGTADVLQATMTVGRRVGARTRQRHLHHGEEIGGGSAAGWEGTSARHHDRLRVHVFALPVVRGGGLREVGGDDVPARTQVPRPSRNQVLCMAASSADAEAEA